MTTSKDKKPKSVGLAAKKKPNLKALATRINASHQKAKDAEWSGLASVFETGRLLQEAKKAVGHGAWGPWVSKNCGFTIREAQRYLFVAKHHDEIKKLKATKAKLSLRECLALLGEQQFAQKGKTKKCASSTLPLAITKADFEVAAGSAKPTWAAGSTEQVFVEKKAERLIREIVRLAGEPTQGTSAPALASARTAVGLLDALKATLTLDRVAQALGVPGGFPPEPEKPAASVGRSRRAIEIDSDPAPE